MALNQQSHNFSAFSHSNSESFNKNDFNSEKLNCNFTKKANLYTSTKSQNTSLATSLNGDIRNLLSTESKFNGLKKRLYLPIWLLEGILLTAGTKESWYESLARPRMGKVFACPSAVQAKTLLPFLLVWNELLSNVFDNNCAEKNIRLKLNKFLTGTKKDIEDTSKEIENIFSSPLKLVEIKLSKKTKSYTMSKKGSLNFIRHAQIDHDVDGVWLSLNFTNSFQEICYPPELKNNLPEESQSIVSISPIVMQSIGSRMHLKKMLNYLFLEFSKQNVHITHPQWNSFYIDFKKISNFHKDFLNTAPALYDHGILGWNNCAPSQKISEIKNLALNNDKKRDIVCAWQLSEQVKEAFEIEQLLSQKIKVKQYQPIVNEPYPLLFPEPPEDQLKKAREEKRSKKEIEEKESLLRSKKIEKKHSLIEQNKKEMQKNIITQTLFDDGIVLKRRTQPSKKIEPKIIAKSKIHHEISDNEFLVLVSEFYDSLKPFQKKAFEKDRKGMSRDQFKAYMCSILYRKKSVSL